MTTPTSPTFGQEPVAPVMGGGATGASVGTLAFCPSFADVTGALDWFEEREFSRVVLWRGPDGLVRGSGRK